MTSKLVSKLCIGLLGVAPLLAMATTARVLPPVQTVTKSTEAPKLALAAPVRVLPPVRTVTKPVGVPVACRNCGDNSHGASPY